MFEGAQEWQCISIDFSTVGIVTRKPLPCKSQTPTQSYCNFLYSGSLICSLAFSVADGSVGETGPRELEEWSRMGALVEVKTQAKTNLILSLLYRS